MYSQNELVRRFARGATTGTASNMEIRELDDGTTQIIGYSWAVYSERDERGEITLFDGWRGYSVSTTQQLGKIRPVADHVSDAKPMAGERPLTTWGR